jgi:UDP-N-acetylglucosamine--dolichyl-phosphate N-acetylglucosaminephosphotransferase
MSFQTPALESALIDGAIGGLASFAIITLLIPFLIRFFKKRGRVGIDVHKIDRPQVAELGGVGIILGIMAGLFLTAIMVRFVFFHDLLTSFPLNGQSLTLDIFRDATLARIGELALLMGVVGLVGLYDDFFPLKGRQKPLATLGLTALAFSYVVTQYYLARPQFANNPESLSFYFTPYIEIPGHVPISLTILFPLITIFAITIGANSMNMMDVYNGIMPATTILVGLSLAVSALILQRYEAFYLVLPFLGGIIAYYRFNRFPAKVFSGDVGSLSVGAGLVLIAFLARLEIVLLIAFIPFIINGLDTLLTVGFKERRDMDARPTLMTEDGRIALNPDPRAPVPLANLFLIDGPRTERELIHNFVSTVALSSLLGVVTAGIIFGLRIAFRIPG